MRLIRQANLSFQQGSSDKVYEVDLCEVGKDQFVVNFRYGRRGRALRDGTKTPAPVTRARAEQIFVDLVESKTKKGYTESSTSLERPTSATPQAVENASEVASADDPVAQAILNRLLKGHDPDAWKLSRAIWRAGELGVTEAEVLIARLIGTGDAMLDYNVAAALSRIGSTDCLEPLEAMVKDESLPNHVRRMADEAKRQISIRDGRSLKEYIQRLPDWARQLAENGPPEDFSSIWFERHANRDCQAIQSIDTLYFIDNENVRPALLQTLRTAALQPSYFRHIRRIFKTSELRRDGEVFGILAARFAKEKHNFVMPPSWHWGYGNRTKPTVGDSAQKSYSKQTREYLRGRAWRTLERLGQDESADYCKMAAELLLQFSDKDAQSVTFSTRWNPQSRHAVNVYRDGFGRYWAFCNILYRNSERYIQIDRKHGFECAMGLSPDQIEPPTKCEEAFPELWDQAPELLLRLLQESQCERVHQFAAIALISNESFCEEIDLSVLMDLLAMKYGATCSFAFEVIQLRYDAAKPDRELVAALANCNLERGRAQAHRWIEVQRSFFFDDPVFVCRLVTSSHSDTRLFARDSLRIVRLSSEKEQLAVQAIIDHMLAFGESEAEAEAAVEITETVAQAFSSSLSRLDSDTIARLFAHPLAGVQMLGGEAILKHERYARNPPPELLSQLIGSEHANVRGVGLRIVNQLNDHELKQSIELLLTLTRHPQSDVRNEIRPTVKRLAGDSSFAQGFADRLIQALLIPGAPEGVPSHTARLLIDDLRDHLGHVDAPTVWKLLQSRSQPAQDVGGTLVPTNLDAESLSVEEIVKLASHDVLSVREASWAMCEREIDRLRNAMASAVRLLDAKWEDSREFGFKLFRDSFEESHLTPSVLVSICDSVREDVQQFGCGLITKRFEDEGGQEYLIKLSEHPSASLQLFATNFLERYAADHPERLRELEPYFMSVLTRVNKGRVAKDRILALLSREAVKNEDSAQIVSGIMTRVSATASIGDRARTIEVMSEIRESFPAIDQPIEVQPVEVR